MLAELEELCDLRRSSGSISSRISRNELGQVASRSAPRPDHLPDDVGRAILVERLDDRDLDVGSISSSASAATSSSIVSNTLRARRGQVSTMSAMSRVQLRQPLYAIFSLTRRAGSVSRRSTNSTE